MKPMRQFCSAPPLQASSVETNEAGRQNRCSAASQSGRDQPCAHPLPQALRLRARWRHPLAAKALRTGLPHYQNNSCQRLPGKRWQPFLLEILNHAHGRPMAKPGDPPQWRRTTAPAVLQTPCGLKNRARTSSGKARTKACLRAAPRRSAGDPAALCPGHAFRPAHQPFRQWQDRRSNCRSWCNRQRPVCRAACGQSARAAGRRAAGPPDRGCR